MAREYIASLAEAEAALRAPDTAPAGSLSAQAALHPLLLTARDVDEASAQTAESATWRAVLSRRQRPRPAPHTGARRLFALTETETATATENTGSLTGNGKDDHHSGGAALDLDGGLNGGGGLGFSPATGPSSGPHRGPRPRSRGFVEALLAARSSSLAPTSLASPPSASQSSSPQSAPWVSEPVPEGTQLSVPSEVAAAAAAAAQRPAGPAPVFLSPFSAPSAGPAPLAMAKRYVEGWGVWPGSCHVGALTVKGHAQLWALGQALRRTYGPAMDLSSAAAVRPETLYARSTDYPRTLQSLQGLLLGFVQTVPAPHDDTDADTDPSGGDSTEGPAPRPGQAGSGYLSLGAAAAVLNRVPIHTTDGPTETMVPNHRACPALRSLHAAAAAARQAAPVVKELSERVRAIFTDPTAAANDAGGALSAAVAGDPYALFDCAGSHLCTGNPLPAGLTPDLFQELEDEAALAERARLSFPTPQIAAQLGAGGFASQLGAMQLRQIMARAGLVPDAAPARVRGGNTRGDAKSRVGLFRGGTAGPWVRSTRLAAFSGHDTSLTALLAALGVWRGVWPPYASHAEIELFRRAGDALEEALTDPDSGRLRLDGLAPQGAEASGAPADGAAVSAAALAEERLREEIAARDVLAASLVANGARRGSQTSPTMDQGEYDALGRALDRVVSAAQRARVRKLLHWYYTRTAMHPSSAGTGSDAANGESEGNDSNEPVHAEAPAPGTWDAAAWLSGWMEDDVRINVAAVEIARHRVRVVYNGDVLPLPFCTPSPSDVTPRANTGDMPKDEYAHLAEHDAGFGAGPEQGFALCPLVQWLEALTLFAPRRRSFDADLGSWNGNAALRTPAARAAARKPTAATLEAAGAEWHAEQVMGFGREASQFDFRCGTPAFMNT